MKKSFLLRITMMLLTMLCTVTTWADTYDPVSTDGLSSYDLNAPFGFGAGVTGSEDENPVIRCQLLVSASLEGMTSGGEGHNLEGDAREGFWMDEEGFDEEE